MCLDGVGRDLQPSGDFLVGLAGRDQSEDFELAFAEPEALLCLRVEFEGFRVGRRRSLSASQAPSAMKASAKIAR